MEGKIIPLFSKDLATLYLESKGLKVDNMVIYNMLNTNNPKIPLLEWLKEFEQIVRETIKKED